MADKKVNVQVNIKEPNIQPTIAELRKLKKEIREVSDPEQFKILQQQINDYEDALKGARVGADNFAEVIGTLPGPIGNVGNAVGGTLQSLKQFGSLKFTDLKASFVDLGKDVVDAAKGIGNLTGITKIYTVLNNGLAASFVKVGIGEQAAAVGARAFSAALTATGIGAIVVALGFLIEKLIEVGTEFFNQSEKIRKASEKFQEQRQQEEQVYDATAKRNIASLISQGKTEKEVYDAKIKYIDEARARLDKDAKVQEKNRQDEIRKADAVGDDLDKINQYYNKLDVERKVKALALETERLNLTKELKDKEAQDTKEKLDKEQKLRDQANAKIEADRQKQIAQQKSDLEKITQNEKEAAISLLEVRDQERRKIIDDYNQKINLASKYNKDTTALEEAKLKALGELNDKFRKEDKDKADKDLQEKIDLTNKKYDFELQLAEKIKSLQNQTAEETFRTNRIVAQSWVDLGNNIAGVFGSLINVFENGSDAAKAFGVLQVAVNAASSIGQILLNSQAGQFEYTKAIATGNAAILAGIPKLVFPPTAPLGAAEIAAGKATVAGAIAGKAALKTTTALQIGTVGVTSAAQIAAILSSGKSRGSSGVGGGGATAGGGGASITPPSVSQLTVPQLNTTGGQNPSEQIAETLATAQKPLKAYVVSGEITSQQALDRRTNRAATFG